MSLRACAEIVRRGDPDRFLASMAAPVAMRAVLFPLYAFNVEVARAPWVTAEPMLAEIRLTWWRDALEEIEGGGPVRPHAVTTPLAGVLDPMGARHLMDLVAARRWDIYGEPFADGAEFSGYLDATAGGLSWVSACALGVTADEAAIRRVAWAGGLARWFQAVPELMARSRKPLVDARPEAVVALATQGLAELRSRAPRAARPALLWTWQAKPLLSRAQRLPERVLDGALEGSEFAKRLRLLFAAWT